jgi:lysophospholipase L1-like esterase
MMSWPAQLSRILRRTVVNRGIPGNTLAPSRVHCLPCGIPGIDRFGRDVLAVPHVRLVLVALGLNDLLQGNGPIALPGSYRMLIAAAHAHGVRIIAITITPNLPYRHAALEAQRRAVNRWIATAPFDGVVDVSGLDSYIFDGIHPDARGYTEMARVIAESLD